MSKGFAVGRVAFTIVPSLTEYGELQMRSRSADLQWYEVVEIIERRIAAECRVVADGVIADMAGWEPEQWVAAKKQFA